MVVSLDLDLFIDVDCGGPEPERIYLFDRNYTHNVVPMWEAAGVYSALYESDGMLAGLLVDTLAEGVAHMERNPKRYERLNPPNGWGSYETALPFLRDVLAACRRYPKATVGVRR